MTSRSISALIAAPVVALALLLAGCAAGSTTTTPTTSEKWTPNATPTTSATPTPTSTSTKTTSSGTPTAEEIGQGIIKILEESNVSLQLTDAQATCIGQAMLDEPGISEQTLKNTANGRDIQQDEAEKKLVSSTLTDAAKTCTS